MSDLCLIVSFSSEIVSDFLGSNLDFMVSVLDYRFQYWLNVFIVSDFLGLGMFLFPL